ncbi:TrbI/VirB10 family protein [Wolbachia endosymbiont of Pentidionis agamae]|uniref:TrbI/VirB10 family protein n=1 Tax=Wolbachia endosymbiont of Pentidionis agamae TaxID=3110435 RepID=UPI002FD34246
MTKKYFEQDLVNESEVEDKVITVGSKKKSGFFIFMLVALLAGVVYYFYIGSSNKNETPSDIHIEVSTNDTEKLREQSEKVPEEKGNTLEFDSERIRPVPSLPPLVLPKIIPEVQLPEIKQQKEEKLQILPPSSSYNPKIDITLPSSSSSNVIGGGGYPKERRGTSMLTMSGTSNEKSSLENEVISLAKTPAQKNIATKIGKTGSMIIQGKIIDAVLETAISTDLTGTLRAVVSRDVYAEASDTVLIPRGSRLIGESSFQPEKTKTRVNITWKRVILPNGIDVIISSPATDELGRIGVRGIVDNKIVSSLFSSVLIAGVSMSAAYVAQKTSNAIDTSLSLISMARSITSGEIDFSPLKDILNPGNNKDLNKKKWKLGAGAVEKIQNASDDNDLLRIIRKEIGNVLGNDTSVGSISLADVKQLLKKTQGKGKSMYESTAEKAINDFSKDVRDIIERYTDKKPTIYVDQGTAIKVFVSQDIVFPKQAIYQ